MTCGGTRGKPGSWRKVVPLTEPNQKTSQAGVVMYGGSRCPGCSDCRPCQRCEGFGEVPNTGEGQVIDCGPTTATTKALAMACPRCQGSGVEPKDLGDAGRDATDDDAGRHGTTGKLAPSPSPEADPPTARESTEEPDFLDEIIGERWVALNNEVVRLRAERDRYGGALVRLGVEIEVAATEGRHVAEHSYKWIRGIRAALEGSEDG